MDVADIEEFDIDRSIEQAWNEFQARLGEIISVIDDSGDLTIGIQAAADEAPYLRLSSPRRDTIRCEATGDAGPGAGLTLPADRLTALEERGWQPPSLDADPPTDSFWIEVAQEDSDRLSEQLVWALREVYGVQHPVFLHPDQLVELLQPQPAPIEQIGSAVVPVQVDRDDLIAIWPRDRSHLDDLIGAELARMFGHPPIRDAEGDVAIRVGSTMLFLRTSGDAQEVVLFAAVVHDVAGRSRAAEVLNDLNVDARWVKFQLVRDRVFVTFSVLARPFVPAHLHQAVRILSEVADGIDDDLAAKLHGRTTFGDHDDPQ